MCSYSALPQEVPIFCVTHHLPCQWKQVDSLLGQEFRGKKMGGSESKATVLENMIKNFKKRIQWRLQEENDTRPAPHPLGS